MNCGEFTPMADSGTPFSRVHFFPKNGNKIIIAGQEETIPPGVGVISGGIIGVYNNANINKVPGQTLSGNTLYYVYVFKVDGVLLMDFSTTGHIEDTSYGNQVHATDPSRSLVGMVYTDASGKFIGNNRSQLTSSWFNRGETGLHQVVTGDNRNTTTLTEANPAHRLEWLQWGMNNTFQQGFTVPNIYFSGTLVNNVTGSYMHSALMLDGVMCSHISGAYQSNANDCTPAHTCIVGANGTNEGYHWASLMLGNGGTSGVCTVASGAIYSSPLQS